MGRDDGIGIEDYHRTRPWERCWPHFNASSLGSGSFSSSPLAQRRAQRVRWPTAVATLTLVAGFAGVSIPKNLSAGWVAACGLAVVAFLFARAAYKLHAERDRPFPDVEVAAGGVAHTHPTDFFHLLSIPTRVTNRGAEDVSLSFLLFFQHGPNPDDRLLAPPLPPSTPFFPTPQDVESLQTPPKPLNIAARKGDGGSLVFMWYTDWNPLKKASAPEFRLQVTDHVSRKVIEIGVPGRYGDSP